MSQTTTPTRHPALASSLSVDNTAEVYDTEVDYNHKPPVMGIISHPVSRNLSRVSADTNIPTEGDDTLFGTEENDTISGLAGNDVINGLSGKDKLDGGAGSDIINGGAGNDLLDGGVLDDYSQGAIDTLIGNTGNDTFLSRGFFGAGNYSGGDGTDRLDFSQPDAYTSERRSTDGAGVKVNLAVGSASTYYLQASDFTWLDPNGQISLAAIENVRGTGQGDILIGDDNANELDGGAGSDVINGGSGDDSLDGGVLDNYSPGVIDTLNGDSGNDTFLSRGFYGQGNYSGGEGVDWLDFSQSDAFTTTRRNIEGLGVKVDLTAGTAFTRYQQALDSTWPDPNGQIVVATIENIRGTVQGDILIGDSNANELDGGAGNDVLKGGEGADTLTGGIGDDSYEVDSADDVVTEAANAGTDTVQSGISYSLSDNLENLTLIGTSAGNGTGTAFDNIIIGNSAANTLNGGDGNDTLDGGALDDYSPGVVNELNGDNGDDTFLSRGFFGADSYAGGDGVDGIDFSKPDAYTAGRRSAEGAGVKVDLAVGTVFNYYRAAVNYTWTDPNGQIVLAAIENVRGTEQGDIINGDGNANLLDGGAGSDVINGGSGDDTLDGGALDDYFPGIIDTLKGNTGNDTFLSRGFFGAGNYGGGDGIDWLDFSQSDAYSTARRSSDGAGVKVDLAAGNASTYYLQASGFTWLDPNGQIRLATIENVRGTGQGDIISGDSNANQLDGGAGNDVLNGGAGADTLIGGAGDDTYVVDAVDDIVTEAANAGNDTIQAGFSYYSLGDNFENLTLIGAAAISGTGNDLDNILIGNSATNMLNGGAGNDTLDGGALDEYIPGIIDSLNGNSGNDTLLSRGFFGASNYAGGDGADWLDFSRPDVYTAARRNADDAGVKVDLAAANASTYYLQASDFTWLDPNGQIRLATIENVRGTGQDDNISGDGNANELDGGAGSDVLNGGSGDDSLDGGALDEYIPGVINTLNGNSGNDSFLSRGFFGAGNYAGGDGIDRLDFSRPDAYTATRRSSDGAGVKVDLAAGNASAYYLQASDFTWLDANGQISLAAIENVLGTEQGDLLIGDGNANEFDGGAGNDVLNGGAGADTLIGGAGDDTYVVDAAFDRVYETESAGNDTVQTSFTYSLGGNLENLTLIGTIAVSGVGNALDNTITGNSAANTLSGGGGNDTLDGGALDDYSPGVIDKLNGNTGDDTFLARGFFGAGNYAGGDGSDWIDFSHPDAYTDERRNADGAGIKVNLSVGAVSTYYLQASGFIWLDPNGQISVTGVENVRGTEQGDIIIGDSNANEFDGGSGNDVLNGGLGADTLIGGGGDDIYTVDAVDDIVTEAANAGIDTVQAGISYSLGDNLENLTLTGITAISGIGNDFDNILIGNSAVNTLNGGAGNDTLDGGVLDEYSPGVIDILNGDAGNDSLLFRGFFGSGNFDGGEGSDRLDFSRSDSYTATRRSAEGAGVKVDLVAGSAFSYYRSADGYTQINSDGPIVFTSIENVIGTAQGDILIGDDNANELDGGAGSDVVNGGSGDDTLAGGALDEYAPGVTDTVNGDAGNDTLLSRGFFGADNYDGGDGVDWLDFSRPDAYTSERRSTDGAGAKVDLVAGSASTYYLQASGFTWLDVNGQIALTSIENVRGTEQSDNINGDDNANKLDGGAGSDVVNGGAGDDTLSGGALDEYTPVTDTLNGGDGNDAFLSQGFFGAGDYAGGDGADWLDFSQPDAYTSERRNSDGAGAKVDLAAGSASTYYLQASGFTWLDPNGQIGLTTIENVRGTGQGDIIIGDSNANEFDGGAGSDVLNGGSGNDILDGGVLDDYTPGVTDRLNGDAGNDTFLSRGFFGAGDYSGGEGADWLDFSRPDAYTSERRSTDGAGIKVDLAAGSAYTYYSQASGFTWFDPNGQISLAAIENVLGTAQGDILIGDSHANVFDAGAGSDVLNGGSGDDILDGGVLDDYSPGVIDTLNGDSGNDTFLSRGFYGQGNYSGGEGVDWLDFSRPDAFTATHRNAEGLGIKVDLAVGTAFTRYQQALDFTWPDPNGQIAVASIENIRGTEQSDILIGDGNANQLDGGAGNDVLKGGEGADALIGGIGDDSYEVDSASDVVTETANAGSDTVLSGISYSLGDNLENLTLIGTSAGNGTGNAFGNIIIGNSAANILNGGDGNDTLDAGALDDYSPGVVNELNGNNGDDTFLCRGFFGADSYAGGDGADWLDFSQPDAYTAGRRSGEGGGVKVDLVAGKAFTYYVGAKDFTWNDPNGQIALASIENIRGTAQDDILSGDNNANVFDGGAGNDLLMGGLGADTFQLRSLGNIDTLQNYSIDDDTIQLDNAAFTAFTHTGTLAASSLRVSVAVKA
ncbi:MAG: hypothetical protein QX199_09045, partial [Methylococcaceae bacterium]